MTAAASPNPDTITTTTDPQCEDTDLGHAALAYARHGWRVFPLAPRDKRPLTANGFKDATTDPDQIAAWWQQWPDANIGAPVPDGHLVVDVDVQHGGTLAQLGAMPPTVTARTGGGGWHLWTTVPPDAKLTGKFRGLTGVDVRKVGNYVVLPPSVHPSGTTYRWEQPPFAGTPIAPLPEHLLAAVREQPRPPRVAAPDDEPPDAEEAEERAAYFMERAKERAADDGRNNTGFWLACQLRDNGLDQAEAEGVALDYQAAVTDLADEPYTEEEALAAVAQAYRRDPREATTFGGENVAATSALPDPVAGQAPTSTPRSLSALLRTDLPAVKWAVPDLIPQGLSILAGRPKVGKSWLGLALAVAVGTPDDKGRALGRIACPSGHALYLALEDTNRRLRERTLRILGSQAPAWQGDVDVETTWERLDKGGYTRLDSYLTEHADTRLVLIDTFAKIRPAVRSRAGISYDEDYQAMSLLKRLADQHETAFVVIHHTRKGAADDPQDLVSGTTGLTGAADSTLVLFRPRRGQEGEMKLFLTGRDIEEQELGLAWDERTCTYTVIGESAAALELSAKQRHVVDYFRARDWQPCHQHEVLRGLGLDTTRGGVGYQLLQRMLAKGALRRAGEQITVASYLRDSALPSLHTHVTTTNYITNVTASPASPRLKPPAEGVQVPKVSPVRAVNMVTPTGTCAHPFVGELPDGTFACTTCGKPYGANLACPPPPDWAA